MGVSCSQRLRVPLDRDQLDLRSWFGKRRTLDRAESLSSVGQTPVEMYSLTNARLSAECCFPDPRHTLLANPGPVKTIFI